MTIETRDFGKIEISEAGILTFTLPILGFETQSRFVILYDDDLGDSLAWLQSTTDKDVCFIIIDPCLLLNTYAPSLKPAILSKLALSNPQDAAYRCLLVVPKKASEATVNLRSPLVINPKKKLAAQVILDEDYPVRAPLKTIGEEKRCLS